MCDAAGAATSGGHDILGYAELCRPGAAEYLEKHQIPRLFRSLVAALMVEQPPDHVAFIKSTLAKAVDAGVSGLDWETFVYPLHPKRSPQRLQYVRDGSAYERQGVELMEQQLRQQHRQPPDAASATSPAPPPLSPAPSLTSSGDSADDDAGDLFELTQVSWADSAGDPRAGLDVTTMMQPEQQPEPSPELPGPDTQAFVSSEVDKLLSEAMVLSVSAGAASSDDKKSDDEGEDPAAVAVAELQAKLQLDLSRGDIAAAAEQQQQQLKGSEPQEASSAAD